MSTALDWEAVFDAASLEPTPPFDWEEWRFRCPNCGRLIASAAVTHEVYLDPGNYYGVGEREWADCGKCGRIQPDYRPFRTVRVRAPK